MYVCVYPKYFTIFGSLMFYHYMYTYIYTNVCVCSCMFFFFLFYACFNLNMYVCVCSWFFYSFLFLNKYMYVSVYSYFFNYLHFSIFFFLRPSSAKEGEIITCGINKVKLIYLPFCSSILLICFLLLFIFCVHICMANQRALCSWDDKIVATIYTDFISLEKILVFPILIICHILLLFFFSPVPKMS